MEKYNSVFTGFISNIIGNLLMFVTTLLLVRYIDTSIYGEFRLILSFISLFVIVLLVGRDSSIIYHVQIEPHNINKIISEEVMYGIYILCIGTFVLYIFDDYVVNYFFNNKISILNYDWALLMLPLWGIFNLLISVLKVYNFINYSFLMQNLIQRFMRFIFLILFITISQSYISLITAMIISQVVLLIIVFLKLKNNFNFNFNIYKNFFLRLGYSFKLGFNSVIFVALLQIDIIMIGKYLDTENVAVYDIVVLLSTVVTLPFVALVKSSETFMREIVSSKIATDKYFKNTKLATILSLCILLIYTVSTKEILSVFGEIYMIKGEFTLIILSYGYLIMLLFGIPIELLNMNGKGTHATVILVSSLFLNLALNYILIPKYGINGSAISTIVSLILSKVLALFLVYKSYKSFFITLPIKLFGVFFVFLYLGELYHFSSTIFQIIFSIILTFLAFLAFLAIESNKNKNFFVNL